MDDLPNEVLTTIFNSLHQHDKMECMLVCRRWSNIIEHYCLFHTLQFSDKNNYKSLLSHFNKSPQTERFASFFDLHEGFDFTRLFPHLRMVFLQRPYPIIHRFSQQEQQPYFEQIVENVTDFFTSEVLLRGMCPNLSKIVVNATITATSATPFIRLLKHAPNLKYLSMTSFQLSFINDIEILHQTVPALESVELLHSSLENEAPYVLDITPALTVTAFKIGIRTSSISTPVDILYYLQKKYPNMVQLEAHNFLRDTIMLDVENRFFQLLKALCLHTISIEMTQPKPELFQLLDEANCRIGNITLGADLNTLDVWHKVARSNQVNYIHTLKLVRISFNFNDDFYDVLLKQLKVLKNLVLEPKEHKTIFRRNGGRLGSEKVYPTVWLDQIFLCCPSKVLGSLTIEGCRLNITTNSGCLTLTHLELSIMELPNEFDAYVSASLPHLKHLVLTQCGMLRKEFYLPNHHLSTLKIIDGVNPKTSRLLVINGKGERLWVVPKQRCNEYIFMKQHVGDDSSLLPYFLKVSNDPNYMMPDIIFTCKSVDNIIFLTY